MTYIHSDVLVDQIIRYMVDPADKSVYCISGPKNPAANLDFLREFWNESPWLVF